VRLNFGEKSNELNAFNAVNRLGKNQKSSTAQAVRMEDQNLLTTPGS
jgi:hypothetical protein